MFTQSRMNLISIECELASLGNQTLRKSERRVWEIGWGKSVHSGMLLALIICLLMLA